MSTRNKDSDGETAISPTELRALRRLAEPDAPSTVEARELWASRYRIIEPLGRGGMGDVYLARDVLLDRLVALKVLRNKFDDELVDERLLLREARAAARAEHERIARVYDAGTWNDRAFIAMEYVRGETLREWMKTHQPSLEELLFIVQQLLEGVRALHERELVHRDLKPENVMVASDGNLRILDLGIARRVPLGAPEGGSSGVWPSSASIGFGVGTPGYMAPEQWQAVDVDARADLFAIGVMIYELVVGSAPFKGANNAIIREKTLTAEVSFSNPEWDSVPAALRDATRIALSRDREQRYASVELMSEPLAVLFRPSVPPISGARTSSVRPGAAPVAPIDSTRGTALSIRALKEPKSGVASRKWPLAAGGVLVLAALTGGAVRYRSAARALPPATRGMVRLAGGEFSMGTDAEELAALCKTFAKDCPPQAQQEVPKRTVRLEPFEIDEREVTNQQFAKFLNEIGSSLQVLEDPDDHYLRFVHLSFRPNEASLLYDLWPGTAGIQCPQFQASCFHERPGFEKLPVTQVTWFGANLFCKNAGKRLPTEAEWEFAARGSERRLYPWGSSTPSCTGVHTSSLGWLKVLEPSRCDNAREIPFPVASAAQDVTPEGVRDLAGNVSEWVDSNDHSNADAAGQTVDRPAIFRGGAFNNNFQTRSAARGLRLAFNVGQNLGFRCAQSVVNNH
ncbi:MAG: bifunctional serine/threonine-protein kinase/formylglycine-generating enzyme family protein [Myxococcales bacterium]